jgi:hypothetical protein
LLDDELLEAGTYRNLLLPGGKVKISILWTWDQAPHQIKFEAEVLIIS